MTEQALPVPEIAELRARIGRLEVASWLERALLALLIYVSWDELPGASVAAGSVAALLFAIFAIVERVRRL